MKRAAWRLGWYEKSVLVPICLYLIASGYSSAQTPRDIAQTAFPSVVLLGMRGANGQLVSVGSGFFVRSDVVATNLHVIEGATEGYARIVGQEVRYDIAGTVGIDTQRDLALLKIVAGKAPPMRLGDSREIAVGDEIYAIGNPLGLEGTFSQGIISGIRKLNSGTMFQITAPISRGSSGGPVLNNRGEVIGVAVATFKGGQNLNFAIPASYLTALLRNIKPVSPLSARRQRRKDRPREYWGAWINSGLGIKGGWFLPTGGETDIIQTNGVIYGVDYLYIARGKSYGVDLGFLYSSNTQEEYYLEDYGWVSRWTVMAGEASLVWFPTRGKNLYIGAGAGYCKVQLSDAETSLLDQSGPAFHILGGYVVLNMLFVEIKYGNTRVEEDAGARGVSVHAGLRF